jgi:hypothetical protein
LEFRGTATRYARREVLRLLKALELKARSRTRVLLSGIKRELDSMSDAQLEEWVSTTQGLSPELAAALGVTTKRPAPPASAGGEPGVMEGVALETLHRVQLLPGLELLLSASASPAVQRVAQRLYAEYVGSPPG